MAVNQGSLDRAMRMSLGIAMMALGLSGVVAGALGLVLVGAVLLFTGTLGRCPLYRLMGWHTDRAQAVERLFSPLTPPPLAAHQGARPGLGVREGSGLSGMVSDERESGTRPHHRPSWLAQTRTWSSAIDLSSTNRLREPHSCEPVTLLFRSAAEQFEAAHEEDPRRVTVDGQEMSWSVHYHRRLLHWVLHFEPVASIPLRLSAQCQHIRRWTIPRNTYEEGRQGYRRWRRDLATFHAAEAGLILRKVGYDEETTERVGSLLRKVGIKRDPEVQTLEDAICMVFLETEFADFSRKHREDKIVDIIRRTWLKMSEEGHRSALELVATLPAEGRALLERALGP